VTKIDFDIPAIASVYGLLFIAAIRQVSLPHPALRGMARVKRPPLTVSKC